MLRASWLGVSAAPFGVSMMTAKGNTIHALNSVLVAIVCLGRARPRKLSRENHFIPISM
jgi:hypothetical protein